MDSFAGHMTTCWITGLCLGILLIFTTMLLSYTLHNAAIHHIHPKCVSNLPDHFNNNTIHIVHEGDTWSENQLEILQYIVNVYKDYDVHISILKRNESSDKEDTRLSINNTKSTQKIETTTMWSTKSQKQNNESSLLFYDGPLQNFDAFTFFEKLRNNLKAPKRLNRNIHIETAKEKKIFFEDITNKSNIRVDKHTYQEYFKNTPLIYDWINLDKNMLIFASRIQDLWQYGGVSFYLPSNYQTSTTNSTVEYKNTTESINKEPTDVALKSLILTSKSVYESLPTELVSIDRKGYHMGSKIPCHSFFGELIAKITANGFPNTAQVLIEETLRDFCKRGAVNSEDCKII